MRHALLAATLVLFPQTAEDPPHAGRAFVFELDPERGRALGWCEPDASDERLQEAVRASMYERVRSGGRFVEATVAAEPDGRVSVTFVGHQAPAIERLIVQGLATRARLALVEPSAAAGEPEERQRLAAWLAADEERRVVDFALVPPAEGGARPGLAWAAPAGKERSAQDAVAIGSEGVLELRRPDWKERVRLRQGEEGRLLLSLQPDEELQARLAERLGEGPAAVWVVLDQEASRCELRAPWDELRLDLGRDLDGCRPLLMALGGEPYPVPLAFDGFEKRPLPNVRLHVPGDDDG